MRIHNAPIIVRNKKYYTYEDPDYSITKSPLSKEDLNELSSALDIIRHSGSFTGLPGYNKDFCQDSQHASGVC